MQISSVFNSQHHHVSTAFSWFDLSVFGKDVIYNLKYYLVIPSSAWRLAVCKCKGFLEYDAQVNSPVEIVMMSPVCF